jgi:hypothetical protein
VSLRDPQYFELSDGRPYIPIGLNMIAPPGNEGLLGLEVWMERLQANGGNYIGSVRFSVQLSWRCFVAATSSGSVLAA